MKINNFKKASAVTLACLNVGSVFAQGKIVTRNHSNFKKYEQTKKTSAIDLPQIATILSVGGLLFVGADELIVRPIIKKFSRKASPNPSGAGASDEKEDKNLSVFKDEKDIINSSFDYLKRYINDKTVNDYLEAFRNFGLKLCDHDFGDAKSITVEELYNIPDTGLKELLNIILQDSTHSLNHKHKIEDIDNLVDIIIKSQTKSFEPKENGSGQLKLTKNHAPTNILKNLSLIFMDIMERNSVMECLNAVVCNIIGPSIESMSMADVLINQFKDIDDLCASLAPVITGENKDNLKESADKFLADQKYATAKEKAIALFDKYVDFSKLVGCQDAKEYFEKRFNDEEYPEKNIKSVVAEIVEIYRDFLKEDYKPVGENIKNYLEQKLKELIPYEE